MNSPCIIIINLLTNKNVRSVEIWCRLNVQSCRGKQKKSLPSNFAANHRIKMWHFHILCIIFKIYNIILKSSYENNYTLKFFFFFSLSWLLFFPLHFFCTYMNCCHVVKHLTSNFAFLKIVFGERKEKALFEIQNMTPGILSFSSLTEETRNQSDVEFFCQNPMQSLLIFRLQLYFPLNLFKMIQISSSLVSVSTEWCIKEKIKLDISWTDIVCL